MSYHSQSNHLQNGNRQERNSQHLNMSSNNFNRNRVNKVNNTSARSNSPDDSTHLVPRGNRYFFSNQHTSKMIDENSDHPSSFHLNRQQQQYRGPENGHFFGNQYVDINGQPHRSNKSMTKEKLKTSPNLSALILNSILALNECFQLQPPSDHLQENSSGGQNPQNPLNSIGNLARGIQIQTQTPPSPMATQNILDSLLHLGGPLQNLLSPADILSPLSGDLAMMSPASNISTHYHHHIDYHFIQSGEINSSLSPKLNSLALVPHAPPSLSLEAASMSFLNSLHGVYGINFTVFVVTDGVPITTSTTPFEVYEVGLPQMYGRERGANQSRFNLALDGEDNPQQPMKLCVAASDSYWQKVMLPVLFYLRASLVKQKPIISGHLLPLGRPVIQERTEVTWKWPRVQQGQGQQGQHQHQQPRVAEVQPHLRLPDPFSPPVAVVAACSPDMVNQISSTSMFSSLSSSTAAAAASSIWAYDPLSSVSSSMPPAEVMTFDSAQVQGPSNSTPKQLPVRPHAFYPPSANPSATAQLLQFNACEASNAEVVARVLSQDNWHYILEQFFPTEEQNLEYLRNLAAQRFCGNHQRPKVQQYCQQWAAKENEVMQKVKDDARQDDVQDNEHEVKGDDEETVMEGADEEDTEAEEEEDMD